MRDPPLDGRKNDVGINKQKRLPHTASPHRDAFLCLSAQAIHQLVQVRATAILAGQFAVEAATEVADVSF